jgi:hypothetical protein
VDTIDQGRAIIHIAKTLKLFSADDPRVVVRHFAATRIAGNAGLFAASIRGFSSLEMGLGQRRLEALHNDAGIDVFIYRNFIEPWLFRNGLAYSIGDQVGESYLVSTILTYDALLRAVVELFAFLYKGREVERACHYLVHLASGLPFVRSEALSLLAAEFDEPTARLALDLAQGLKLLSFNQPMGTIEQIIYSDRVWKQANSGALRAISRLSQHERAALEIIVDKVRQYQGHPEQQLRDWARQNNVEPILDLAIGVGIVSRTGIVGAGKTRNFLTTPHFYVDVEDEFGEDVCDRVKIFLDSIRQGQHFSHQLRGQIWNPSALLEALINRGTVGPATAIGEDYTMAERAGIVRIERSAYRPGQYHMVLIQYDVVRKTLEVIQRQVMEPSMRVLVPGDFADHGSFVSIPEMRAKLAELPEPMKEAEREFLNTLREK